MSTNSIKHIVTIVAKALTITFHGSKMWSEMTETEKVKATEMCLPKAHHLRREDPTAFNTILRLQQSAIIYSGDHC